MSSQSSSSQLFEIVAIGSCFIQCCMMLFNGSSDSSDPDQARAAFHMTIFLHLFSMASLILNSYHRGTRIHMYPLVMGFTLYSMALFFMYMEEIAYYYYYLMVLTTMVITYFFGSTNFYNDFETSGRNDTVGCVITSLKVGGNRVSIYYPTPKNDKG